MIFVEKQTIFPNFCQAFVPITIVIERKLYIFALQTIIPKSRTIFFVAGKLHGIHKNINTRNKLQVLDVMDCIQQEFNQYIIKMIYNKFTNIKMYLDNLLYTENGTFKI